MMGSPATEEGRDSDETQHRVTLTHGFWMGETEVTLGLWEEVMGSNPSHFLEEETFFWGGEDTSPNRPVDSVSWNDCQKFIRTLNTRSDMQRSGMKFSLPTEAQWEYACRAGTIGAYGGMGRLDDMGWDGSSSGNRTHLVGQKKSNAWGLYDMHGNVWEWCQDRYGNHPGGAQIDPSGPSSGSYHINRGGSGWIVIGDSCSAYRPWNFPNCRSDCRSWNFPGFRFCFLGLRLAAVQETPKFGLR